MSSALLEKPKVHFIVHEPYEDGTASEDDGWYVTTVEKNCKVTQGFFNWNAAFRYASIAAVLGYAP